MKLATVELHEDVDNKLRVLVRNQLGNEFAVIVPGHEMLNINTTITDLFRKYSKFDVVSCTCGGKQ